MGGKRKPKEPGTTSTSRNDNDVSAPSNIFKTLFGDAEQNLTASSLLFSDSNPFKRKSQEPNQTAQLEQEEKRKAIKVSLEEDEDEVQKVKVLKTHKSDAIDSNSNNENKKKKKKRKRDDIETEYEAKKYGNKEVPNEEDSRNLAVVAVGEKRKKSENAEDMLVSKDGEGFDDEDKLLRTVFVGNLPLKLKKKTLIKEFSQFGEIESVRIRSVPIIDTKIPRKGAVLLKKINDSADSVHAYIVFKTQQSAVASLVHNMSVVGGNHIRVDRACPPRKKLKGEDPPLYDNKRTLFVGNLPFDVKDEEIYQLLSSFKDIESSVEAVRVVRHSHLGLGKGIAYVLFKTREAANLVLRKKKLMIRDRELRLSHAKKDSTGSTPSKRKSSLAAEETGMPIKRLSLDSRTLDRTSRSNTKASLSYQGLRSSKTGAEKKLRTRHSSFDKAKSNTQTGDKRKEKRPAVSARKAKSKANDGSSTKQAGQKRKLESRTPQSSNMKKRAKRFRK